jgi:hypothetical protein
LIEPPPAQLHEILFHKGQIVGGPSRFVAPKILHISPVPLPPEIAASAAVISAIPNQIE